MTGITLNKVEITNLNSSPISCVNMLKYIYSRECHRRGRTFVLHLLPSSFASSPRPCDSQSIYLMLPSSLGGFFSSLFLCLFPIICSLFFFFLSSWIDLVRARSTILCQTHVVACPTTRFFGSAWVQHHLPQQCPCVPASFPPTAFLSDVAFAMGVFVCFFFFFFTCNIFIYCDVFFFSNFFPCLLFCLYFLLLVIRLCPLS